MKSNVDGNKVGVGWRRVGDLGEVVAPSLGTRLRSSTSVSPFHVPPPRFDTSAHSIPKNPSAACAACSASWEEGERREKEVWGGKKENHAELIASRIPWLEIGKIILLTKAPLSHRGSSPTTPSDPHGSSAAWTQTRSWGATACCSRRRGQCEGGVEEGGQGAVRRFDDVLVSANQVSVIAG
jgi:hypothetical protein